MRTRSTRHSPTFGETLALPQPVELHGRQWEITSNLNAALRHLRDVSEELLIWVDALCIDQSSVDERNSQVLLMKSVYSKAAMVRVWLGESTPGSDEAIEILKEFSRGASFGDIRINGGPLDISHTRYVNDLLTRS